MFYGIVPRSKIISSGNGCKWEKLSSSMLLSCFHIQSGQSGGELCTNFFLLLAALFVATQFCHNIHQGAYTHNYFLKLNSVIIYIRVHLHITIIIIQNLNIGMYRVDSSYWWTLRLSFSRCQHVCSIPRYCVGMLY